MNKDGKLICQKYKDYDLGFIFKKLVGSVVVIKKPGGIR